MLQSCRALFNTSALKVQFWSPVPTYGKLSLASTVLYSFNVTFAELHFQSVLIKYITVYKTAALVFQKLLSNQFK